MKNSIKKSIMLMALGAVMVASIAASAASSYLTGGVTPLAYNLHSAWADHEHYTVTATIDKGKKNKYSQTGWGHASTRATYGGEHGFWSAEDEITRIRKDF